MAASAAHGKHELRSNMAVFQGKVGRTTEGQEPKATGSLRTDAEQSQLRMLMRFGASSMLSRLTPTVINLACVRMRWQDEYRVIRTLTWPGGCILTCSAVVRAFHSLCVVRIQRNRKTSITQQLRTAFLTFKPVSKLLVFLACDCQRRCYWWRTNKHHVAESPGNVNMDTWAAQIP